MQEHNDDLKTQSIPHIHLYKEYNYEVKIILGK